MSVGKEQGVEGVAVNEWKVEMLTELTSAAVLL